MSQLLQDLLSNALKYRDDSALAIHITSHAQQAHWNFSVRDNAIGVPPHYAQRVFEMFQRLHGRNEYPGTGLRLAICKQIVERQGGRIWGASNPARESELRFTIAAQEGGAE